LVSHLLISALSGTEEQGQNVVANLFAKVKTTEVVTTYQLLALFNS
jgi:hypothetical protein